IGRLQQIRFQRTTQTHRKKIIGAIVEVESNEVGCRRLFNSQFLLSRNFRAKTLSDRLGKLPLDCKQVIQIALVFFRPNECASKSVYQPSLEMKTRAPATAG